MPDDLAEIKQAMDLLKDISRKQMELLEVSIRESRARETRVDEAIRGHTTLLLGDGIDKPGLVSKVNHLDNEKVRIDKLEVSHNTRMDKIESDINKIESMQNYYLLGVIATLLSALGATIMTIINLISGGGNHK